MSDHNPLDLKPKIKQLINDQLERIKSGKAKQITIQYPEYVACERSADEKWVSLYLTNASIPLFKQTLPYVQQLRTRIPHITEQTPLVASYLILARASKSFLALISLAKNGNSHEMMQLSRFIQESCRLAQFFCLGEDASALKRWFDGEIIAPKDVRSSLDKYFNSTGVVEVEMKMKEIGGAVYGGLSQYPHCGYSTLIIDSIDPFSEDFDFNGNAGYHFTREYLPMASEQGLIDILMSLRCIYLALLNDQKTDTEMSILLKKILPELTPGELEDIKAEYSRGPARS